MGTLYLVSTPIGNLKDITLRAIEVLSTVDVIACEDTRKTGLLLKVISGQATRISNEKFLPKKPTLISYYEQNEDRRIPEIINFLKNGQDVALVSNAGTPTISDPGFKLVRECITQGIRVEATPGPSAVITSLVASGLPTDKFIFLGFLPKKKGKRIKILKNLTSMIQIIEVTVVIYSSPHRLVKELTDIQEVFGDIVIVLCRELTKIHEEIRREKISQTIKYFEKNKSRGEFTLLFHLL